MLPEEVGCLTQLEELRLSGNPLKDLPSTIGRLQNLEVRLSAMPLSISHLRPILIHVYSFCQTLDLNGCLLRDLPDQITYLWRVMELDLGLNQVETELHTSIHHG